MTVTHYTAEFVDSSGKAFVGQVYWDKYHPRKLQVNIAPRLSESLVDYPIWESSGPFKVQCRAEMNVMAGKMKTRATRLGLTLTAERLTRYAPPESPVSV